MTKVQMNGCLDPINRQGSMKKLKELRRMWVAIFNSLAPPKCTFSS